MAPVDDFPEYYLQESNRTDYIPQDRDDMMCELSYGLKDGRLESEMYPYIITLLTRMSLMINEGHYANILHHDIRCRNILINYDGKLKKIDGAVPIDEAIDKTPTNPKDEGMLVDLDNTAELNNMDTRVVVGRTGTSMFIAIAVSKGRIRQDFFKRVDFPELSREAKDKYIDAYGEDVHNHYRDAVNNSPKIKDTDATEEPVYQHAPHHDIESFFWVCLYELLVAWPEGAEVELSPKAANLILALKSHTFHENSIDGRMDVLTVDETYFEAVLHPRLKELGTMLYRMAQYVKPEWAYWESDGLPPDHIHEAFKRLLLDGILLLKDNPIALQERERGKFLNPARAVNAWSHVSSKAEDAQTPKKRRIGNREPTEDEEPRTKKSKVSEQAPGTAGRQNRRFREAGLLQKVRDIPFVMQINFSEEIKDTMRGCEQDQTLITLRLSSGCDPVLKIGNRRVPRLRKQRSILKSKGQSIWRHEDVCQILKAGYEGIQGHQLGLIHAKVLHRDISRGNILINPVHYDTKFKKLDGAVPINKVLDKTLVDPKEEGMIIDLDNAVDLNNTEAPRAFAGRTGAPMFIAIAVGGGRIKRTSCVRDDFPEISPEAEKKYRDAYGDDVFDRYPNAINDTPQIKNPKQVEEPAFQHSQYHDIESFFWVFLYELLVAWPENAEEKLSPKAGDLILALKSHSFDEDGIDRRIGVLTVDKPYFEAVLHPDLKVLGTMLYEMAQYVKPEWAYWESHNLPLDHAHEAFKRLLLDDILLLEKYPIALRERERGKFLNPAKVVNAWSYVSSKAEDAQTPKKRRTGNREPTEDEEPRTKKSKVSEQAPETAGRKNSIIETGSRYVAVPPSLPSASASSKRSTKRGLVKPNMGPPSIVRSQITRSSSRRNIKVGTSRQGEGGASGSAENGTSTLRRRSSRLSNKEKS